MGTKEQIILEFAEGKWGEKTLDRIGLKLAEEAGEVAGALIKIPEGRATTEDLIKEMGDCLIVLSQLAAKHGLTLENICEKRFEEIRKR